MNKLRLGRFLLQILSVIPKKYAIGKLEHNPFFVINTGRCGSNLLNRLLNEHSQLFLPTDQTFVPDMIIKFRLYNWILWRDLSKIVASEPLPSLSTHTWEGFDYNDLFAKIVLAKGKDRNLVRIIDLIFRSYAAQLGIEKLYWGDSTVFNLRYTKEIYRAFPKAKFIYLVRDGRDVVASYKEGAGVKEYLHLGSHQEAAKNWTNAFSNFKWLQARTNVLIVKYEDLVTSTSDVMSKVFDHLGVSYESVDDFYQKVPNTSYYKEPYHANLQKPISSSSVGKWKKALSEKELSEVYSIMEGPLKKLGYLD